MKKWIGQYPFTDGYSNRNGLLAPQAGGSVLIQTGDTAVLVTATRSAGREGIDFLPLTVDYEERLYAVGRIPGGFLRRRRPPERFHKLSH